MRGVDVRALQPVNPWGLHNIRGLEIVSYSEDVGVAISGSEDGDLTVFEFPSGRILSKVRYNSAAQRGINQVALRAGIVLVANCAVGPSDKNLWAFSVDANSGLVTALDSVNLAVDPNAPQVFNFDVIWGGELYGAPAYFCSTEEGLLWMGNISAQGKLEIGGYVPASYAPGTKHLMHLGSGICYRQGRLAVAAYDVVQFERQAFESLARTGERP